MPLTAHLYITGSKQGKIEGSCDKAGREGSILVLEFNHQVLISRSGAAGPPTGKRIHHPLTAVKGFDKSSPKLYQALTGSETLNEVRMDWYRINPMGKEEKYYTIRLEDAVIVSIAATMPHVWDPRFEKYSPTEAVSFSYRKITWTWEPEGIESEDDWKTAE
ncbi:MAG: Hcp family type VI secretion system effector [Pseudomonadota bacterium]